jgi:GAF domain-containing protein
VGLETAGTRREDSLSAHAILESDLTEVPDAQLDERFADNPHVVGNPMVRFYAATPLRTADGHALGVLCVIDHVPRVLTPAQRSALVDLGQQATAQIELRRMVAELRRSVEDREHAETALRRALESSRSLPAPVPAPRVRPGALAVLALVVPLAVSVAAALNSREWEPLAILAGGGLASLLLFGLVWSLADARRGALDRMERMTAALRTSEQRVRTVMDTVADGIVTFGRGGKVE